jgi:predicted TIM-barrel fold metal-dependent hydrolase
VFKPIISSDSHVCEPPDVFVDRIDRKYLADAPRVVHDPERGDVYQIKGVKKPLPLSLISAAGQPPEKLSTKGARFEELHRGGWDPAARLLDQDRDGIAGEIIYPSVGMEICNLADQDYKKACMDAYNLWIAEFCDPAPQRLIGLGQTPLRSIDEGIEDLRRIKALGLRGVMLPGRPGIPEVDYDHAMFDPFWQAAIDLELPLSFHILTSGEMKSLQFRGTSINSGYAIIRANQDIMSMFVNSGVFMRNPKLKIVCVEADAGWVPHFVYRLDHTYNRHRFRLRGVELDRMPSEYFLENIYLTFQDDIVAFTMMHAMNPRRIMWANDFPHSDSTWPWSQELLQKYVAPLPQEQQDMLLHDNVAELYGLKVA